MNAFANTVGTQMTRTENGALTHATTGSALVNFFSLAGSARKMDVAALFMPAFLEDKEMAMRMLFWLRDIRGGAGEREAFRKILLKLEQDAPVELMKVLHLVPEYGRFDDLLIFQTKTVRDAAFAIVETALAAKNGLCAKWMPRKGELASQLREYLGWTPKRYRKTLVNMTKVVETQMCAKEWSAIDFSKVPSVASARYQKAFGKNAPKEYGAYLAALESNDPEVRAKVKINADALFPHDVVRSFRNGNARVAEQQWKALPNFAGTKNILPMVDTSGSMDVQVSGSVTALDVALGLGLYVAEKQDSAFKNLVLTFSAQPVLFKLDKASTYENLQKLQASNWQMNTNIEAAFKLVLDHAVKNQVKPADMPTMLVVISDMEFDACVSGDTNYNQAKKSFEAAGYEMPKVVFWNVNARNAQHPVRARDAQTALISGYSPAIMQSLLADGLEEFSPEAIMKATLMRDRYDVVSNALKA